MNTRQITAIILLALLAPAATLVVVHRAGGGTVPAEASEAATYGAAATGDAHTVALISVPFLGAGLLIMVGYRKCVNLYQGWHRRKRNESAAATDRR